MKKLKELRAKLDEVSTGYLKRYIGLSKDKKGNIQKTGAAGSLEKSLKKSTDAFRSGDKEARRAATKTVNKRGKGLQMARAKLDKKAGARFSIAKVPATEAVQYKVDVEGLPPTFMTGRSTAEIMAKLRKIVKQPSMIKSVERHTDAEVKKAFRNKAQGREMDEVVTYHGNPNKDDDARNAARRKGLAKRLATADKKAYKKTNTKSAPTNEASVVPSKDGKKLVPMKKHSEPKSEPVPNDQFGLPKLQKEAKTPYQSADHVKQLPHTKEFEGNDHLGPNGIHSKKSPNLTMKQRMAHHDTSAEHDQAARHHEEMATRARGSKSGGVSLRYAHTKAAEYHRMAADHHLNSMYDDATHHDVHMAHHMGNAANSFSKHIQTKYIKKKMKNESVEEAVYGSQAQRMMSPLQKARQDKEKADRDRHGNLNMMKGRPKRKKLGEISMDLKQRYADKAKSDYKHQQFSADIAREMGAKDAEKYYRRKQRNRMAGVTRAKK